MNSSYYVGKFKSDGLNGPNSGWIVGKFMADEPRKNSDVEIKYWEYPATKNPGHDKKTSSIIECVFILKGRLKSLIGTETVTLEAGDYLVIEPGTPNNVVLEVLENVSGLTVKAPSDPTAKQVVN